VDTAGTGAWSTVLPASASQFTFRSLVRDNTYALSVQAVTAAGVGPTAIKTAVMNRYPMGSGIFPPVVCDQAGALHTIIDSITQRCDGLEWATGTTAVYNASAVRIAGGVLLIYTIGTPSATGGYAFSGSLSQRGSDSRKVPDPGVSLGSQQQKTIKQLIQGAFHAGKATFVLNGITVAYADARAFTSVIGINIS
jgi:hypothetical protein